MVCVKGSWILGVSIDANPWRQHKAHASPARHILAIYIHLAIGKKSALISYTRYLTLLMLLRSIMHMSGDPRDWMSYRITVHLSVSIGVRKWLILGVGNASIYEDPCTHIHVRTHASISIRFPCTHIHMRTRAPTSIWWPMPYMHPYMTTHAPISIWTHILVFGSSILQLVEPLPADFTILSLIVRSMSTLEEFHGATSWRADMHTRGIPFESWSRHAYTSPMPVWRKHTGRTSTTCPPRPRNRKRYRSCPQQWNERVLRHMSVHLQC